MTTVPYTLGVFTGNPGDSNAVSQFNNFAELVGVRPQIKNVYIDGTVNPDTWEGSVGYWVGEWKNNAPWNEPGTIPLWGMPMGSTDGTYTPTQILQRYVAGNYDGYLQAVISECAGAGYKTVYCRPGVEMNLSSTPGYAGFLASPALYIQAFQHIYTVLHAQAVASGVTLKVIWNPGVAASQSIGNAMANLWPGKQYVDVVGLDNYADLWPWSPLTDQQILSSTANMEQYYSFPAWNGTVSDASNGVCVSLLTTIAFAKAQGLPIAICECGAGAVGNGGPADNPVWWNWLRPNLDAAVFQGVTVEFVSFWNANGGGTYQFTGGQQPNACTAIAANFGVNAPPVQSAPPTFTVSPPNTQVNGTTGNITDTNVTVWAINAGQEITRNGSVVASSADVVTLFWTGTALDQLNTSGAWWTQPLDGSAGTELSAAPTGYVPLAPPPTFTVSPANTVVNGTTGSITDTLGNVWTINASKLLVWNTTPQSGAINTAVLFWDGTNLKMMNTGGKWYLINLTTLGGTTTTAPAGYVPPFTVSPANTQVNGTSGSITDTLGNVWTINASEYLVWNTTVQGTSHKWATLFWTGSALYALQTPQNTWTEINLSTLAGTAASQPAGYVAP